MIKSLDKPLQQFSVAKVTDTSGIICCDLQHVDLVERNLFTT